MNVKNYKKLDQFELKDVNDLKIGDVIYDEKQETIEYVISCFSDFIQDEVSNLVFNSTYDVFRKVR